LALVLGCVLASAGAAFVLLSWWRFWRMPVVTVPVSPWPGYGYLALAAHQGLDRQQGIRIDVRHYSDPQLIVKDLAWGRLKVAQLTTVELVDLCSRLPRRCPVVVLAVDESRGADQLLLAEDLPGMQALRGQTVAVTPTSLGPFLVSRALERVGLTLQDVNLRNLPLREMPAGFVSGELKAAAMYPPFSSWALRTGKARIVFDSRSLPGQILDVLVVDRAYLDSHRDAVARLLRAWQAAHRYAVKHPRRADTWLADLQDLSAAEFATVQSGIVYTPLADQLSLLAPDGAMHTNLLNLQRVQAQLGLVPSLQPLPQVSDAPLRQALAGH
jgi:NitT/TauT family transport system substrate-binding protein